MSSLEDVEKRLLQGAREHLEPDEDDRVRIRSLLAARLSAPDLTELEPHETAPHSKEPSPPSRPSLEPIGVSPGASFGWLKLVAATALGGGLGFGAGYRVGQRDVPPPPPATHLTVPSSEERPSNDVQPTEGAAAPVEPAPPSRDAVVPPKPVDSPRPGTAPFDAAEALYRELSLVRRAERAIRQGEPLLALGLLRELDETFPDGRLQEERAAARAMALCQRELDEAARAAAHAFEAAHPNSVYLARVRELCRRREE